MHIFIECNSLPDWDEQLTDPQRETRTSIPGHSQEHAFRADFGLFFRSAFYAVSGLLDLLTALAEAVAPATPGRGSCFLSDRQKRKTALVDTGRSARTKRVHGSCCSAGSRCPI